MIEIREVSKEFKNGNNTTLALKNVNIHIEKGDIFGIMGMSGAGKSTLLRCLSLLAKPSCGDIIIDGKGTAEMSATEVNSLRKDMGVVFQGYNLLKQCTIYENIAFPLKINKYSHDDIDGRVKELLELINLSDKEEAYPSQLSGGQKQRIAIARALATNPKILLCDEPTSALDPLTTKQILGLLKEINQMQGITIVIITHEMQVVKSICNRVAVIDQGQVAETGSTHDIFSAPQSEITKLLLDWSAA